MKYFHSGNHGRGYLNQHSGILPFVRFLFFMMLLNGGKLEAQTGGVELLMVKKIWEAAPHNAFTDLVRFNSRWYCVFREGENHVGTNGKIRVIRSKDGLSWEPVILMEREGVDLRDPKLTITPRNQLMLHIGGSVYENGILKGFRPAVVFSKDGRSWSDFMDINITDQWPWRPAWHKNTCYVVGYGETVSLYSSENGINYQRITDLTLEDQANEAALCFLPGDTLMVVIRRDKGERHAMIGKSAPPYIRWEWMVTGISVGGPSLTCTRSEGRYWSGRSFSGGQPRTVFGKVEPDGLKPLLTLPSGGDCSYPGMVWFKRKIWMSYYSSHEGKTAVYLAKIKF